MNNVRNSIDNNIFYSLEDARKIVYAEIAERKEHKKMLILQKIMGVAALIMTAVAPIIMDGDITLCFVTAPMGIGLLVTKEIVIG